MKILISSKDIQTIHTIPIKFKDIDPKLWKQAIFIECGFAEELRPKYPKITFPDGYCALYRFKGFIKLVNSKYVPGELVQLRKSLKDSTSRILKIKSMSVVDYNWVLNVKEMAVDSDWILKEVT